jgi:two-component system, chemotaxis family, chemotaxis protein CheY
MSKRVLVVDDSNFMRHRISSCLSDAGHQVVGKAKDGNEAVTLYKELRPDVVTMDITMRGRDGISAAKEILGMDPDASIIFYTLLEDANVVAKSGTVKVLKLIKKGDENDLLQTLAAIA